MSKLVRNLISEIKVVEGVDDTFTLNAIAVNFDSSNEVESMAWIKPVRKISADHEHGEILFHYDNESNKKDVGIVLADVFDFLDESHLEYSACVAIENEIDGNYVRIDYPIIGTGENLDEKRCLFVVQA